MAHLNKLDCEYTLEEAKNVDVNDITTHPFFKKHFSKAVKNKVEDSNGDEYVSYKIGKHEIRHYPVNHKYDTHMIEVGTHASRNHDDYFHYYGSGQHKTAHTALESAIKQYKDNVSRFKPLTESLVGKKPATASKLFAEAMEARLDEISKKTLGSYAIKAVQSYADQQGEVNRKRELERNLNDYNHNGSPASKKKSSELSDILQDEIRKHDSKRLRRGKGLITALNKLTKEDLDESRLDETEDHDYAEGKYAHLVGKTVHSDRGPVKVAHVLDPFAFAPYQATDDEGRTYNIHKGGTLHRAPKFQRGRKDIKEDLDEVEAPANFWNAGMARMNPIQVSQKQSAEPGQFKATLTKSPKRLADQDSSLEGKPRTVRDETEATATSRGPKTIELTGDWHADVPDHQFDPKLDSETEYYPLFSQFKSLGAYPSGPARAWEEEEINEEEGLDHSYRTHPVFVKNFGRNHPASEASLVHVHHVIKSGNTEHHVRIQKGQKGDYSAEVYSDAHGQRRSGWAVGKTSHDAFNNAHERYKENYKMPEYMKEDSASLMATATKDEKKAAEQDKKKPSEFKKLHDKHEAEVKSKMKELGEEALNELSKKTLSSYIKKASGRAAQAAFDSAKFTYRDGKYSAGYKAERRERKRHNGIEKAADKLAENALEENYPITVPRDENGYAKGNTYILRPHHTLKKSYMLHDPIPRTNKEAWQDIEKLHFTVRPHAFVGAKHNGQWYRLSDSGDTPIEVKENYKIDEETLEEGLFDPAKHELLSLWDEHARRSDAHGSGSRTEILKRIEDHVAKKHGQEGLKKMKLHTDLTNALKHSLSPDKGHLQAILGNMRSRCAMGV